MSAAPIVLEYASTRPRDWRRVFRWAARVAVVGAVAFTIVLVRHPIERRVRLLSLQRTCADATAAQGSIVVLENLPADARGITLLRDRVAISEFAVQAFRANAPELQPANAIFSHAMRSPNGTPRTVMVFVHRQVMNWFCTSDDAEVQYKFVFVSAASVPWLGDDGSKECRVQLIEQFMLKSEMGLRVFSPRLDAADPSHLVLAFDRQSATKTIDIHLKDDGAFDLRLHTIAELPVAQNRAIR